MTRSLYGHSFGDVVLETLAERFVESIRARDRVYRYGGEEFLILLPETPLDQAGSLLERLRKRVSRLEISDGETAAEACEKEFILKKGDFP